jgi:transposase-like protein
METTFKNLIELQKNFSNEETCWNHLEQLRWNGTVICPFCHSERHYKFQNSHTYKCKDCKKKFNAKIGTIFENTKIPLSKWFVAIYIATSHKKGISSIQLSKDIGVTQKTAWFILGRIREMLKAKAPQMLNGMVEIDETYVGGREGYKHKSKRKKIVVYVNKTMVFGILERQGNVWTKMVDKVDGSTLKPIIRQNIDKSNILVTDGFGAYTGLKNEYKDHVIVNHEQDEWVKGNYHTNTIEGFWSQLKRGIYGIYHHASPKHLHRYCHEFSFRYNTRKSTEEQRFNYSFLNCNSRLTYKDLIKD